MNIKKENNELVVRIPLKQKINNPYIDEKDLTETDNLVGIIAGNEYSLSQRIDLDYKGDQQEGSPIIMFNNREELEQVCKDFEIAIWEHPLCETCGKAIRGAFTVNGQGNLCYNCERAIKMQCKIANHIPTEDGEKCECGYFKRRYN